MHGRAEPKHTCIQTGSIRVKSVFVYVCVCVCAMALVRSYATSVSLGMAIVCSVIKEHAEMYSLQLYG